MKQHNRISENHISRKAKWGKFIYTAPVMERQPNEPHQHRVLQTRILKFKL